MNGIIHHEALVEASETYMNQEFCEKEHPNHTNLALVDIGIEIPEYFDTTTHEDGCQSRNSLQTIQPLVKYLLDIGYG